MNERMGTLGAKSLLEIDETRHGVEKLAALQVTNNLSHLAFLS